MRKGCSKNRKAFVIYEHQDICQKVSYIESICSEMNFKLLKLDELECQKSYKLNKISEATQSHSLSCLPEPINDKLKILERIVNNSQGKLTSLINQFETQVYYY
jgi:hypothetical protein